jgi:hypothetical protein
MKSSQLFALNATLAIILAVIVFIQFQVQFRLFSQGCDAERTNSENLQRFSEVYDMCIKEKDASELKCVTTTLQLLNLQEIPSGFHAPKRDKTPSPAVTNDEPQIE